jgi:3-oxoacyl-[acyl-carrier-protein] synthase-3
MNDDREPADQHKTLAFDVTNGDVGFLKAVYLAAELVRAGQGRNAMVVASELENNVTRRPDHLLGIRAAASAIILRESQGESGFLSFGFRDYPELAKVREVHGGWHDGGRTVCLTRCEQGDVGAMFLECLLESVRRFLESAQTSLADIHWFVPTQHSEAFLRGFAAGLDIDSRRVVNLKPAVHGDPQTSTFTLAMDEGIRTGRFKKGDLCLVASVCGGVQVGCSLYRV